MARLLRWAPAAVALLSVLMVLASPLRGAELGDEGVIAVGAWRIASGQIPGRDFFAIIPPLSFLPLAGLYALFGVTVWAGRALAAAYAAGLALVSWHLASRLMRSPLHGSAAVAPLVSCGVAAWLLPSHHWLADLLALSALAAFVAALDGRPLFFSAAGGALAAACALTLQDQGGTLLVALAWWIASGAPRPARRSLAAGAGFGAAVVSASAALWLLPRVPASVLLDDWVLFPLHHYHSLAGNAGGLAALLDAAKAARTPELWRLAPVAFALWNAKLVLALAAVPAAVLLLGWMWRRDRDVRPKAALVAAVCAAFLVPALRRPAPVNWEWALPPFALAAGWGLERWRLASPGRRAPVGLAWLALAVFAGAGLVRLPALLSGEGRLVRTPAGTLGPVAPARAGDLQGVVDAVDARLSPGEPLFSAGFIPLVNVLTLHPDPTRYDVFVPPAYTTPGQVRDAIGDLEKAGVRWVLQPAGFTGGARWGDYLREGFRPAWANGAFELWERMAPRSAPRQAP